MDWTFFDIVQECGLHIVDIAQAPNTTGYYMLFAENGEFIYVGKAANLYQTLTSHFGSYEKNERIKGIVEYAIWWPTRTIVKAEEAEGHLYDTWVRSTGVPPFANKNKPPKSKLRDDEINEIRAAKHRQILENASSLRD